MVQLLQAGAGVKILINGSIIGFATGLSFTRQANSKFIYGIDSPIAQEIALTTYAVQGTLTGFRVRDGGGLDGPGIMDLSTVAQFFNFKYCDIEVVDRVTNKSIYIISKCVFDSDSWSLQAKSLITFNANFKGTFVTSESSGSAPNV